MDLIIDPLSFVTRTFRITLVIGLLIILNLISETQFSFGADIPALVSRSTAPSIWPSLSYQSTRGRVIPTLSGEEFGRFAQVGKLPFVTVVVAPPIADIALPPLTLARFHKAPQPNGETTVLGDLYLADDHPLLAAEAAQLLASTAVLLDRDPRTHLTLEAYCDERNTEAYAFVSGQEWVSHVGRRLEEMRVEHTRMTEVSYGTQQLSCHENSPTCWEDNLRMKWSIRLLAPVISQQGCLVRLRLASDSLISQSALLATNQPSFRRIEQGEPFNLPASPAFHTR